MRFMGEINQNSFDHIPRAPPRRPGLYVFLYRRHAVTGTNCLSTV